ncbi:MAG: DUF4411 family protein [Candidatus Lokiarchaeia archaeon]
MIIISYPRQTKLLPENLYPNTIYSFDTNVFIETWRDYYPIDLFSSLWDFISNLITQNKIIATHLVKVELGEQRDELVEFVNQFQNLFVEPTLKEQKIVNEIINHPNFSYWANGQRNKADPFVVALAKAFDLVVVTYESHHSPKKIPAACREFNVECIYFIELLRREDFKF